jgi:16S rRNA (cytidine1402-2'-O)-methyltransferase
LEPGRYHPAGLTDSERGRSNRREDTRHTRKLLSAYDIHTSLTSYFDQNETQKSGYLLQKLLDGKSIALVSDAGTPGISDPGYDVIVAAIAQQIPVMPIPGPSAMLAALTVSGLALDSFVFIGFLTINAARV